MTRRYGEQITLRKVSADSVDYVAGVRTRTYVEVSVRRAVRIPAISERTVTYSAAMMQAIRPFAWQGGGQDITESGFLIFTSDIRDWGPFDSTQRIKWNGQTFEVTRSQEFDGGTLVWVKVAQSDIPDDDTIV